MLPMEWVLPVAGLAAGAAIAWMVAGRRTAVERQRADGLAADLGKSSQRLEEERARTSELSSTNARLEERLAAEKQALEDAKRSLGETFGSLAAKALQENNKSFLTLAQQDLGSRQVEAARALESKEKAIETMLKPVGQALEKLQATTHELEVKREGAYQAVLETVKGVAETSVRLGTDTRQLIEALRKPQVRGSWGQEQLQRCIEFAGMVEHVSFDTEVTVRDGDSSLRPDCVVHLPNERTIVIDVKTPLEAMLNASNCTDESERAAWLVTHARNVKHHLDDLSSKSYWKRFSDSPEFVVCFLPSEAAFSAALDQDGTLIEYGSRANVILATPTTLIALLKAVAYGWQQMEIARNAVAITDAARALYDKLTTARGYFESLGKSLSRTVAHYNSLVGCVEGRDSVFDQARRMQELGIDRPEIQEIRQIHDEDSVPRELKARGWKVEVAGEIRELAAAIEPGADKDRV